MDVIKEFHQLYKGRDKAYGITKILDQVDEKGKQLSESHLIKKPLTEEIMGRHIRGEMTAGGIPIMKDSRVNWAALDIDVYKEFNFNEIIQKTKDTPFLVCRSKSGGAHLYVFFKDPAPAGGVIEKLESFRARFGHGSCEIFPKQWNLSEAEYGNFINLPYSGGDKSLRYCMRDSESGNLTLEQFITYAKEKRISYDDFNAIDTSIDGELFPEGPPCLNALFAEPELEMRNISLANTAVYFKKAKPDTWKEELNALNQTLSNPLPDRELEAIKKSYEGTDYKYQCSKEPLCRFCDNRLCRSKQFGIGFNEIIGASRDISKINTDPPIWLYVLRGKAIRLSTDQLHNFSHFSKRCMEELEMLPDPIKQKDWHAHISEALKNCKSINIPQEMTPFGMCKELIQDYFDNASDKLDVLAAGESYRDADVVRFKLKDLLRHLSLHKFNQLKPHEISMILTEDFKAEKKTIRIGDKAIRHLMVPYKDETPVLEAYTASEEVF